MARPIALAARRGTLARLLWQACCAVALLPGCTGRSASSEGATNAPAEMVAGTSAAAPSGGPGVRTIAGGRALPPTAAGGGMAASTAPQAGSAAQPAAGMTTASAGAAASGMSTRATNPGMRDPAAGADRTVTFHNGGYWQDASGARIEAHGGGLIRVEDTWYWFGEDKSGNSAGFKGVNCYASKDLVTWESRGAVVTRDTAPELNASDRIIERPKVSYNASTKRYVM